MMARTTKIVSIGAAVMCLFAPAWAAGPIKLEIVCGTLERSQPSREFRVLFTRSKNKLKPVSVMEKQRVFTPGNAVAVWSTANGGTMIRIPDQRPGKWTGKVTPTGYEFTLKAADGSAGFFLTAVSSAVGQYRMEWIAAATDKFGEQQSDRGIGICREQGPQS
jgi:hypothetical protein